MAIKDVLKRMAPTRTLADAGNVRIVGYKYMPHLLVIVAAVLVLYYVMGWELP